MYVHEVIGKAWNAKRLCSGGHEKSLALPRDFLDDLRACRISSFLSRSVASKKHCSIVVELRL